MNAYRTPEGKQAVLTYYDKFLKEFTVPYSELTVTTRHGDTAVLAAGNVQSPPVFLLHGSSMNSTMWVWDMNLLSKHFRVYAPDMPGEPGKSSEKQLPFDDMSYVEWLHDLISCLGISKAALVGISLGAWLAAKFTSHHPQIVDKLVLLCPAGVGSQNHAFKDIAMALLAKGEAGVDELFSLVNGGVELPEFIVSYQKIIAAVCNSRQEDIPFFSDAELQKINMPSLLIVGAKDILLDSFETARRYKKIVPQADVRIIPDAGHVLPGFTSDIAAFLMQ